MEATHEGYERFLEMETQELARQWCETTFPNSWFKQMLDDSKRLIVELAKLVKNPCIQRIRLECVPLCRYNVALWIEVLKLRGE